MEDTEVKADIVELSDEPFNVSFTWGDRTVKVSLVNGEDVLKIANAFASFLLQNDIPCIVEDL